MNIPTWIPDWKDEVAYPNSDDMKYWAWEFLRRNPEYTSAYNECREVAKDIRIVMRAIESPEKINDYIKIEKRGCDPNESPINILLGNFEKFSLSFPGQGMLPDPAKQFTELPRPLFDLPFLHSIVCTEERSFGDAQDYEKISWVSYLFGVEETAALSFPASTLWEIIPFSLGETSIRFNLNYPVKPQLDRARKLLEKIQKELTTEKIINPIHKRNQTSLYPKYLRVLDGEVVGASTREMASILSDKANDYPDYNGDKDIRNCLAAARKLRDHDYKYLPISSAK